jgi:MoxR-like ATPase
VIVDYPSFDEEKKILDCFDKKIDMISPILSKSDLLQIQEEIKNIQISDFIKNYIIQLVHSIRKKDNYILL